MRRRRKRAKFTWLPTNGTFIEDATELNESNTSAIEVKLNVNGTRVATDFTPMVRADLPREELSTLDDSLSDIIGSEYVIRRIVGKCFVSVAQQSPSLPLGALWVKAGIFVGRADTDVPNVPLGADTTTLEAYESFSPTAFKTVREPWVWQRSWILTTSYEYQTSGSPTIASIPGPAWSNVALRRFPATNAHYGSVLDGPHVDIRTGRRIHGDERLYFVVNAMNLPFNAAQPQDEPWTCYVLFDYRILGALRKARQRSNF